MFNWDNADLSDYNMVKAFFIIMLMRIPWKKSMHSIKVRDAYNTFYDWLYKYSTRNLNKTLACRPFQLIYKNLVRNGQIQEVFEQSEPIRLAKDVYERQSQLFLSQIINC